MSRVLLISLMAIAVTLALLIVYQLIAPVAPIRATAGTGPAHVVAIDPGATYSPPPLEQFNITSTRAMFDPSRRPAVEPTIMAGATSVFPPDLSLVGVAISGTNAIAFLRREGEHAISARQGDAVAGWQVVRIERSFVVFRGAGGEFTLKTRAARGLAQPPVNNAASPAVTGPSGR